MNDIRNIRFYGHEWAPDFFKALSGGLRSKWMRFLNGLRWRLELRVQWHAQYLLKSNGAEHLDAMRTEWQKEMEPPSRVLRMTDVMPMHPSLGTKRSTEDPVEETNKLMARLTAHPRSQRYARSRRSYVFHDLEPSSGEGIDNAKDTETSNAGHSSPA